MPGPERVGRYLVLGELGRGAMGTVYRARDEGLEREVALKVMSKGAADDAARARFLREARAAAKLQHPNIVVIYELGEHAGVPYMALELLEGVDLQHAIEQGLRPDPRVTLPLVLQMLAGLGHAHEQGVVHRDVKPSNVFLPVGRPAKIMDFGVARLAGAAMTTTSGAVSGTPSYMSPEQAAGEEVDGRSDLFSVGLILYELVTGEKAIQGDSVVAAMYKVLHETPDLSRIPQGPEWRRLRALLQRTFERQPGERFPDARSMSSELVAALADLGGTPDWSAPADQALLPRRRPQPQAEAGAASGVAPASPQRAPAGRAFAPVRTETRGRRRLVVPAVAIVVVLAAAVVWLARGASPPPAAEPTASPVPASSAPSSPPDLAAASSTAARAPAALTAATPSFSTTTAPASGAQAATPEATTPPAPEATNAGPPAAAAGSPAAPGDPATHLVRAREALVRKAWAEALAEARTAVSAAPNDAEARGLAQLAEAELVVEDCLRKARAALDRGDRDGALEELRRGSLVRRSDPRLIELHRLVVQQ